MSAVKVTCLVISCDRCGLKLGQDSEERVVHLPVDSPYEESVTWREVEWRKVGDRDLCPDCWTYGGPPGDDPDPEPVVVELPHPLSGRVGA